VNVDAFLAIRPAPRAVFDRLPTHRDRARFHVRRPPEQGSGWEPVTWGQFATQIRGVARWLVERGVAVGDHVGIYAPNSVAWASAALGIQTAGAVVVPIYPASTTEQVEFILDHCEATHVFVAGTEQIERLGRAKSSARRVLLRGCAWSAATTATTNDDVGEFRAAAMRDIADPSVVDTRLESIDLGAVAQMLYTSGTSGNPKGVPLTHANVGANGADWLRCNAPLLDEGDRDLLWLPMSHIFGFGELCLGNTLGWETFLASPADALELLPEVAPHVFMSVPAYWEKLWRAIAATGGADALRRVTGGRLRFCLSGGAGLKVEIKEHLHAHGLLVLEGYGLTETSPTLTLNRPDAFRFDTVGRPLPSLELRLEDDGEILARGPNVFRGYYKDPDATAAAFTSDGWFRTGDIGKWTADGFLQIVDRKKDILVTAGGKNVPPANIEARFADDPVIERVVVYGDARPYLVAAVWLRPDAAATQSDERARLVTARLDAINGELARYETIKRHFIADRALTVEDGLLTSSLKLRRKAVYERFRDRFEALY
jgi:long-chain acyl-CoA synthetase